MEFLKSVFIRFKILLARWIPLSRNCRCVICEKRFGSFLPYRGVRVRDNDFLSFLKIVGSDLIRFNCPYCFSTDRDRHLVMFLNHSKFNELVRNSVVLHVAPEKSISRFIVACEPEKYVRGDLSPKDDELKIDLQLIEFPDETFDIVIANHVLEHVPDIDKALTEIRRVLVEGGRIIVQTPYSQVLTTNFELKEAWSNPDFCEVAHGQNDHLRVFSRNIIGQIESFGFKYIGIDHSDLEGSVDGTIFGVNEREKFLLFESLKC